ncbi:hypothetical protein CJF39_16980, partial [Pseudomonas lundensis]
MNSSRKYIANRYLYDPLDRLTGAHSSQRFYNGVRIATEIEEERITCFFEHEGMPLGMLRSTCCAAAASRNLHGTQRYLLKT